MRLTETGTITSTNGQRGNYTARFHIHPSGAFAVAYVDLRLSNARAIHLEWVTKRLDPTGSVLPPPAWLPDLQRQVNQRLAQALA